MKPEKQVVLFVLALFLLALLRRDGVVSSPAQLSSRQPMKAATTTTTASRTKYAKRTTLQNRSESGRCDTAC